MAQEETTPWHTGSGYSAYHVLFPLIECRRLVKVCLHGTDKTELEPHIDQTVLTKNRVVALNRLLHELIQLCDDTYFSIKRKKEDVKRIDGLRKDLAIVERVIDRTSMKTTDQLTKRDGVKLVQPHYDLCFRRLRRILCDIKTPINNAGMIFPVSDAIDLSALAKETIEGG